MELLIDSKILKAETRKRTKYVEFSHDRLCKQALKQRQERESKNQTRRILRLFLSAAIATFAAVAVLFLILSLQKANNSLKQEISKVHSLEEFQQAVLQLQLQLEQTIDDRSLSYDSIESTQDSLKLVLYDLQRKLDNDKQRKDIIEKNDAKLSILWNDYRTRYKKLIIEMNSATDQTTLNNNTQSTQINTPKPIKNENIILQDITKGQFPIGPDVNDTKLTDGVFWLKETEKNEPKDNIVSVQNTQNNTSVKKRASTPVTESNTGLSISKHQGAIDWNLVSKEKKIKFAYIKATEGSNIVDPKYVTNITNARKNKIKVGSYHLFTCTSSARSQFENFKKTVDKNTQDLIPVVDIENIKNYTSQQLRDSLKVFITLVEQHFGCKPMIYTYPPFYRNHLGKVFDSYPFYMAQYSRNTKPNAYPKWVLWEYCENGSVEGINNFTALIRFNSGCSIKNISYKPKR